MKICAVAGCGKPHSCRGFCVSHYDQFRMHGDPLIRKRRVRGTGTVGNDYGHLVVGHEGRRAMVHVLIAEKALGRSLPIGACVHHADCDPTNNDPRNLVICPNQAYHSLLHKRMRALAACGHADWLKCRHCKTYGPPDLMHTYRTGSVHPKCASSAALFFKRKRRAIQRSQLQEAA